MQTPCSAVLIDDIPSSDPRVKMAVLHMSQHPCGQALCLGAIAARLNISCSRLRHLLTHALGMSPARYLKERRLTTAAHMLSTSFVSVKEVSFVVGINDVSHFVRDFKTRFGCTPTEYRVLHFNFDQTGQHTNS